MFGIRFLHIIFATFPPVFSPVYFAILFGFLFLGTNLVALQTARQLSNY